MECEDFVIVAKFRFGGGGITSMLFQVIAIERIDGFVSATSL